MGCLVSPLLASAASQLKSARRPWLSVVPGRYALLGLALRYRVIGLASSTPGSQRARGVATPPSALVARRSCVLSSP